MTDAQKLITLQTLLEDGGDVPSEEKLNTYLAVAESEILAWMYHLVGGTPQNVTKVPEKYDSIQVYAVIAGYTQAGAEGEQTHIENGVHRHYIYEDMIGYIRNHVLPYARVGAIS